MADNNRSAHNAFVAKLNELKDQAGGPTLTLLNKLSLRPYPQGGTRRELISSTTHEILKGKRKRLPQWDWVLSFITACWDAALQNQLDVANLGGIPEWNTRWSSARAARESQPTRPAEPPGSPSPPQDLSAASDSHDPVTSEDGLSPSQSLQCYLEAHGRTAARLLRWAQADDAEACFQLALITLLRDWCHESEQWLGRACTERHPDALLLSRAADRKPAAAAMARRYGLKYQQEGKTSIAAFFLRLADDADHQEAATPDHPRQGKHSPRAHHPTTDHPDAQPPQPHYQQRTDRPRSEGHNKAGTWSSAPTMLAGPRRYPDDYPPVSAPLPDDVDLSWQSLTEGIQAPPAPWTA